jgi:translation initiation factor 2 subunit 3
MKPEVNIGLVGHVDHGKTTLTQALTGKWTDTHSEEIKRGITIRLGYADATFYYCEKCKSYCTSKKCPKCFGSCTAKRSVSFIDAPGHETLMATVLSGTALMDGALLLIAANEECPQPQTAEHLKALEVSGIDKIIIVQTKIDLGDAKKNYEQIKEFVKGTVAEKSPIIPVSAIHRANIDLLIEAIEEIIKTPDRAEGDAKMFVARSFDVNKPGTKIKELKGSVIGGSVVRGVFKKGDEIEIKPGVAETKWKPIKTKITQIVQAGEIEKGEPGGLISFSTDMDPYLAKGDALAGRVAGKKLPKLSSKIKIQTSLFDHVIGVKGKQEVGEIKTNDVLMLTAGIMKSLANVSSAHDNVLELVLKIPVCVETKDRITISKQVGGRWHLVGTGEII